MRLCKLHLEDTNLGDESFALLLKSINAEVSSFKSITYKGSNNKFGPQSMENLQKLLLR